MFPEADASSMFLQRPLNFLATDAHAMEEGVAGLQSILPEVNIHRWESFICSESSVSMHLCAHLHARTSCNVKRIVSSHV